MDLPDEILRIVLSYIFNDIYSITNLSSCNKRLLKLCRQKWVWLYYYRTLFPIESKITENSVHIGDVTYFDCRVGEYPGWADVYNVINDEKCCNPSHYTNTKTIPKGIRWKNLFKMCATRTHTLNISKHNWTYRDKNKLDYLKSELERLERKKIKNETFKNKFKLFIKRYNYSLGEIESESSESSIE